MSEKKIDMDEMFAEESYIEVNPYITSVHFTDVLMLRDLESKKKSACMKS